MMSSKFPNQSIPNLISLTIEPGSLQCWNPEPQFLWDGDQWDAGTTPSFLWVQDPKNNQIEQWQKVVPQGGIADLSFQLSEEPLLGTYVINVTSTSAYGSFSVKERGMSTRGLVWAPDSTLRSWPRKQGGYSSITIPGAKLVVIEKSLSWGSGDEIALGPWLSMWEECCAWPQTFDAVDSYGCQSQI